MQAPVKIVASIHNGKECPSGCIAASSTPRGAHLIFLLYRNSNGISYTDSDVFFPDTVKRALRLLSALFNAGDRNRTGTVSLQQDFKSCASASSATPAFCTDHVVNTEWMEVDSNHRSNLQQIYSLSPLATRESIHLCKTSYALTS